MKNFSNFFADYHPVIVLFYFISLFVVIIAISHPVFIITAVLITMIYTTLLVGIKGVLKLLAYMIPMVLFIAIVNPLFNHRGNTPLLYINNNPVTLEATLYGVFAGFLIIAMIFLFRGFDKCITPHKFVFLFGKAAPTIALMITMIMRFIPLLRRRLITISNVQSTMGISSKAGSIKDRTLSGSSILSVLISVSLEGTIDTADSMDARGYFLRGKSHYNSFKYTLRDFILLITILLFDILFGIIIFKNILDFEFLPSMSSLSLDLLTITVLVLYAIFTALPILINILEEIRWKLSRRKI